MFSKLTKRQIDNLEYNGLLFLAGAFCLVYGGVFHGLPGVEGYLYAVVAIPYAVLDTLRTIYIPGDAKVNLALAAVFLIAFAAITFVYTMALFWALLVMLAIVGLFRLWKMYAVKHAADADR